MRLFFLRRSWNQFARKDPLWAVLTEPGKSGQRWQLDDFFATGVANIEAKLATVRQYYPALRTGQALDFGCGVGRLSQALALHFERVVGVDIAEDMIALARKYNRHGERVDYVHNGRPDLGLLATGRFDFVCSLITLQHMRPEYAKAYIAEFVRVCASGGVIFFQVPEHCPDYGSLERLRFSWWPPTLWKRVVRIFRQRIEKVIPLRPVMEMYGIPREEVSALLQQHGARLLVSYQHDAAGAAIRSFDYIAVKESAANPGDKP